MQLTMLIGPSSARITSPTVISAGQVVLATGGAGQVFERTTNPEVATADGVALAYRAGARLADMEFVQFHPTALYKPGCQAFLLSEALRGAGAILLDGKGQRFAKRFHADAELATRDVVAREGLLERVNAVLFSPVHGELGPRQLSEWVIADRLPVRVQLQLHKYIWSPQTRGV